MIRRRRRDDEEEDYEDEALPSRPPAEPIVIEYEIVEPPAPAQAAPPRTAVPPLPAADTPRALATTPPSPAAPGDELQDAIEAVRLLTALLVGGAIEGADQLVTRLRTYEQELEILAAAAEAQRQARGETGAIMPDEDELDRLRFAVVGFVFDAQARLGRGIYTVARLADSTLETADNISRPFRNFFLFRPVTKRVEERIDNLVAYGRENVARWTAAGRDLEPRSRDLATRSYDEIVAEFINMLAANDDIKTLVQQQSISLVAEVRDNVRGRTVTADSVVEDLVRRVLRRAPREDLPEPPPEVQRWAGVRVSEGSTSSESTQADGPTESRR